MNDTPPIAPRKPMQLTLHDHTRVDDYYWLRETAFIYAFILDALGLAIKDAPYEAGARAA